MAEGKANSVFSNHAVCLVLDYGSQYTQLIARRIRDNGVLSMLLPGDVSLVRYTQLTILFMLTCVMQFLITISNQTVGDPIFELYCRIVLKMYLQGRLFSLVDQTLCMSKELQGSQTVSLNTAAKIQSQFWASVMECN